MGNTGWFTATGAHLLLDTHICTPTGMPQYSQLKLTYCSGRMPFYIFFSKTKKKIYLGSQYLNNWFENCAGIFNFQLPPTPTPAVVSFVFLCPSFTRYSNRVQECQTVLVRKKNKTFPPPPVHSHNVAQPPIHSLRKWPCAWLLFHFISRDTCLPVFPKRIS